MYGERNAIDLTTNPSTLLYICRSFSQGECVRICPCQAIRQESNSRIYAVQYKTSTVGYTFSVVRKKEHTHGERSLDVPKGEGTAKSAKKYPKWGV